MRKVLKMQHAKKVIVFCFCLLLWGCPGEDENCEKVMQCEDDVEMFCNKSEFGCGEDCMYFTYEYCYEVCKEEE
tara:strand:- start:480 stop:701 length:222 start_codon:yes stop_codon:yes gene_type:complete